MKRSISFLLTIVMSLSLCSTLAFANEITSPATGENGLYLAESNEETIQVEDSDGNIVDVIVIENIYKPAVKAYTPQSLTPTEEIGERRTYTFKISNNAMGLPSIISGGVETLVTLKVADKAAEIVAKAVAEKLGPKLIPGLNIASWLLGTVAFVNAVCKNNGITVSIDFEYKGIFWHRENRYTYGWYPDGVSMGTY